MLQFALIQLRAKVVLSILAIEESGLQLGEGRAARSNAEALFGRTRRVRDDAAGKRYLLARNSFLEKRRRSMLLGLIRNDRAD